MKLVYEIRLRQTWYEPLGTSGHTASSGLLMISSEESSQDPSRLFRSPVSDDVVLREDPLGYALAVHNGQAAHLFLRHRVLSFVDFIIGLAGEDIS